MPAIRTWAAFWRRTKKWQLLADRVNTRYSGRCCSLTSFGRVTSHPFADRTPEACPRIPLAFYRSYRGRIAFHVQTPIRRIPTLGARARCGDRIKALVRERSKGPPKKGGDINKVTLFRGACWQEADRCRGFFFEDFGEIKCTFVTWLRPHIHTFIGCL